MGRNRLPDELKKGQGTLRPCRAATGQIPGGEVRLSAPSWMDNAQKRMFRSAAKVLSSWKLLTEGDSGVLAIYVTSLSRFVEAERHLKDEGVMVNAVDKNGVPVQRTNAWYYISQSERKSVLAIEQQLGFTPVSRAKILSMIKPDKEDRDDFSEFD